MRIPDESNLPNESEPILVQSESKSELEKLKAMSGKDRLWYIAEYYKFPIIGVIVAIFLVISISTTVYQNSFPTAFHCIYMNNRGESELNPAPLEQDFAAYLQLAPKEQIVTESLYIPFDSASSEADYAAMAKISAMVAAKSLDAIIGDSASLKHYAAVSGCLDLEAFLPEEILTLVSDHLVYAPGDDGISRAYGLDLSNTTFAETSRLNLDPPILYIISNSTHIDTARALVSYLFAP